LSQANKSAFKDRRFQTSAVQAHWDSILLWLDQTCDPEDLGEPASSLKLKFDKGDLAGVSVAKLMECKFPWGARSSDLPAILYRMVRLQATIRGCQEERGMLCHEAVLAWSRATAHVGAIAESILCHEERVASPGANAVSLEVYCVPCFHFLCASIVFSGFFRPMQVPIRLVLSLLQTDAGRLQVCLVLSCA
jgi:hypothetical protein